MDHVKLRDVRDGDLAHFFAHQQDERARHMAAFTAGDPDDAEAFHRKWKSILDDDTIVKRSIVIGEAVVGHVLRFRFEGRPEVSYWLDRRHWGKGIATGALRVLLARFTERPLYARAAHDNVGSIRVLEKCGFARIGVGAGFAAGRGDEVTEYVFELRE